MQRRVALGAKGELWSYDILEVAKCTHSKTLSGALRCLPSGVGCEALGNSGRTTVSAVLVFCMVSRLTGGHFSLVAKRNKLADIRSFLVLDGLHRA